MCTPSTLTFQRLTMSILQYVAESGEAGQLLHANALDRQFSVQKRSWATQLIDSIGCLWREAGRSWLAAWLLLLCIANLFMLAFSRGS